MTVHLNWVDRVGVITIDRPTRRNALDHATLLELLGVQREVNAAEPRCLVLTGAPPAFCSGADLTGVESGEFLTTLAEVLAGFSELPIPTIAAIDGAALGAGTQLAIACDLRVATPGSVFGIPAVKLGLAVDQWTIDRLAREFGASTARSMLLAASTYGAEELHRSAGIHRLGDLHDAMQWANELTKLAPATIAAHKLGLANDQRFEAAHQAAWSSVDAAEGRAAFLEKRAPNFLGR